MGDVAAKLKLVSYETGPDCQCKKNCFQEVGHNKTQIINTMNEMKSNDEHNNYLAGLISIFPVDRHRPRNNGREVI